MAKKLSRHLPGLSLGETAPASKGIKQPKRNGHAFHPIMNKGGAHEKSKGAKRAAAKRQTNQSVREWLGRSFRLVLLSSFIITGCQPETPQGSVTSSEEIPQTAGRSLEDQAYLAQLVRQSEIADSERSLVHVSHTCTLTIDQKTYAVVDMRELVKGATTARGVNQIILLSAENQMVNKIEYGNARPLICDENRLYLHGDVIPNGQSDEGNVLIFTDSGFTITETKEDINAKLPLH